MLYSFLTFLFLLVGMETLSYVQAATAFDHGWTTTADSTFGDWSQTVLMTDDEVSFAAKHYRIISLEKCTGRDTNTSEVGIYSTAQRIKQQDPTIKVFFYWATDQQGINCYAAGDTFAAHPEWHLKDDSGVALDPPVLDTSVPEAAAWWVSIPLGGTDGQGNWDGIPVTSLIDGVLADSGGWSRYNGVAIERLEAQYDNKLKMMGDLQDVFNQANGGFVMANGLNMYGGGAVDPRRPDDHNLLSLSYTRAAMNEHTAVFESVNTANASLNVETVSVNLDVMLEAAQLDNSSKLVFMQTWPGLYVQTSFNPTSTSPAEVYPPGGEPTPQSMAEWRDALKSHFTFAHALYLSIAEPNIYWM